MVVATIKDFKVSPEMLKALDKMLPIIALQLTALKEGKSEAEPQKNPEKKK